MESRHALSSATSNFSSGKSARVRSRARPGGLKQLFEHEDVDIAMRLVYIAALDERTLRLIVVETVFRRPPNFSDMLDSAFELFRQRSGLLFCPNLHFRASLKIKDRNPALRRVPHVIP